MVNLTDLEKLAELCDKGIISQAAFEQKKKIILQRAVNQNTNSGYSQKSRTTFALLAFFFGFWGVHNFYLGKYVKGGIQFLPWLFFFDEPELVLTYVFIIYPFWIASNIMNTEQDGKGNFLNMNESKALCTILALILVLSFFPLFKILAEIF